ncbi:MULTISPECIES: trypsin-like serine peptidase [Myxococcus]|uniref:trypsin-like serine peptidase n=1 Tax=Myxococcus TaxID=32 RepID=UPI0013D6E777|nr:MULTISPECIES: serine protease [Myxococcus]NVJ24475.1 trypsin-like peptidase domain-containing protein [Myxococcus sp. AM011]
MFKHTRQFSVKFLASLAVSALVMGCGEGLESEAPAGGLHTIQQGSICGTTTDWEDVEPWATTRGGAWGNYVLRTQRAVGIIRLRATGASECTGTLIAENILLTAGHCFTSTADAANYDVVFNFQVDPTSTLRTTTTVQIAEGLERVQLGGLDYAVVRLASHAGNTFGSMRTVNALPTVGQILSITQHPNGLRKKYHEGHYASRLVDGQLAYADIDTDHGSSGSAVLSSDGVVVGVHTNGGCTSFGGFNTATSMPDIYSNSTVIPALALIRANGNRTSQGSITMSTSTQSCTRTGNFDDMANGCALRLTTGNVVTVSCTTNGQVDRSIANFTASGATLSFTSSSATSATATFTYAGTGVGVSCEFTD